MGPFPLENRLYFFLIKASPPSSPAPSSPGACTAHVLSK